MALGGCYIGDTYCEPTPHNGAFIERSCEGEVAVVTSRTGCDRSKDRVDREDCASSGRVCVSAAATQSGCLEPCAIDANCGANRFCEGERYSISNPTYLTSPRVCWDAFTAGAACSRSGQCASGLDCRPIASNDAATTDQAAPDAGSPAVDAMASDDANAVDSGEASAPPIESSCQPR